MIQYADEVYKGVKQIVKAKKLIHLFNESDKQVLGVSIANSASDDGSVVSWFQNGEPISSSTSAGITISQLLYPMTDPQAELSFEQPNFQDIGVYETQLRIQSTTKITCRLPSAYTSFILYTLRISTHIDGSDIQNLQFYRE